MKLWCVFVVFVVVVGFPSAQLEMFRAIIFCVHLCSQRFAINNSSGFPNALKWEKMNILSLQISNELFEWFSNEVIAAPQITRSLHVSAHDDFLICITLYGMEPVVWVVKCGCVCVCVAVVRSSNIRGNVTSIVFWLLSEK